MTPPEQTFRIMLKRRRLTRTFSHIRAKEIPLEIVERDDPMSKLSSCLTNRNRSSSFVETDHLHRVACHSNEVKVLDVFNPFSAINAEGLLL